MTATPPSPPPPRRSLRRAAQYALTLPERTVRSMAALTGGVVRGAAATLLPAGVRRGRLYTSLVETTLRFLIEHVGEVEGVYDSEEKLARDFLLRRTAGNGLEAIGLVAFRASPVWVLAALADVCGLGRQLIPAIAQSLKEEGLLDPDASFTTMEQLLNGLERGAGQLAETVNAPPLDVAGLRAEWAKLSAAVGTLPAPALPSGTALLGVWTDLKTEAAAQERSVFELSSLLALDAVNDLPERMRVLSKSAGIAARRGGAFVVEPLLEHYRETLARVRSDGFTAHASNLLAPYVRGAIRAFAAERPTLTGRLLGKR